MDKDKKFSIQKIKSKTKSLLKKFDSNGVPITMTYNGKQQYRTVPGGMISLLARFSILIYLAVMIPQVVDKKKEVSVNLTKLSLQNDTNPFNLNKDNFDVAIRITKIGGQLSQEMLLNRAKYFKIDVALSMFQPVVIGNSTVNKVTNYPIELGPCSADRIGNLTDQTNALLITGQDWVCPKSVNFSLFGLATSITRTNIRIRVLPCNKALAAGFVDDGIACASDAAIEQAIQEHFVQTAMLKTYFDENEFDQSPIKQEVYTNIFNIHPTVSFFKILNLQNVNVVTRDHWISNSIAVKYMSYYNLIDATDSITGYPKVTSHGMLTLVITKYDIEQTYTRVVVSLTDLISKTGGFSSFILLISTNICSLFQFSLFQRSITKKLFKTKIKSSDQDQNDSDNLQNNEEMLTLNQINKWQPLDFNFLKQKAFSVCQICRKPNNSLDYSLQYQRITKEFFDKFDLVSNLQKLRQLEQMKGILLKDHQLQIIEQLAYYIEFKQIERAQHLTKDKDKSALSESVKILMKNSPKKTRDKKLLELMKGPQKKQNEAEDFNNAIAFNINQKREANGFSIYNSTSPRKQTPRIKGTCDHTPHDHQETKRKIKHQKSQKVKSVKHKREKDNIILNESQRQLQSFNEYQ